MSEPLSTRQRAALRDLARLLGERRASAVDSEADFQARNAAADKERTETLHKVAAKIEAEQAAAQRDLEQARGAAVGRFETLQADTQKEFAATRAAVATRYENESEKAEKRSQEARWTISAVAEAKRKEADAPFEEVERKVAEGLLRVQSLREEGRDLVRSLRHGSSVMDFRPPAGTPGPDVEALRDLKKFLSHCEQLLEKLRGQRVARFFRGKAPFVLLLALLAVGNGGFFLVTELELAPLRFPWWLAGTASAVLLTLSLCGILYAWGHAQVMGVVRPLRRRLADAESAAERAREVAKRTYNSKLAEVAREEKERDAKLAGVEESCRKLVAALEQRRDADLRDANEKFPLRLAAQVQQRDAALRQAEERYRRRLAEIKQFGEDNTRKVEEKYKRTIAESKQKHETGWHALVRGWKEGLAKAQKELAEVSRESERCCPPWDAAAWKGWTPPTTTPPVLRFGSFQVTADTLADGPPDERWQVPPMTLPALMPFPQRCSMLLRARDAGRAAAVQALQSMMLRFLTSLPPGKVRFTIIDPVGLGENFAAFMHLADHDEALVGTRIWTESDHIEQRLADMSAHMENVIQKYLRNQYSSIEEYNTQAGEVAEPFRVLVIANFPANFSAEAAKRLVSIAGSGASCGVYVLASADTRQPMPDGFNIADLEQSCTTLAWKESRFTWKDEDFSKFPLDVDAPPGADFFNRMVQEVGSKAKDARRVEVSFDFIAPPAEKYWTADSRGGIDVALGRAGATKRQHLRLGKGTAQHVLIAGKTGSGKSTLLHALITNLALNYGPDEVELYLVDFKKGVEFKAYANHDLPHARVIAIESEREFGLSVLQRLDTELKQRGDRFRAHGVHDVKGYRDATGEKCPRILMIVDEFQEFFVEDDKVSQEAALLLDRLVRQGRAFGLHVLLGSQTLGGAYTLARSTIDQMAVRIALQCSETDANLILSKDNSAARLLSRPGEAIYNDQNGLLEGNDIFQVVWLPDERREELLTRAHEMASERNFVPPRPQLVFEGNAPADVSKNHLLTRVLSAAEWPATVTLASAWLGEAIAIKDPTVAVFRRQSSSNLLLLGQHDEAALGILSTAMVGLSAQCGAARFYLLDGTPADSGLAGTLGRVADALPQEVRRGSWREAPALLAELGEEVERRQKTPDGEFASVFLFLYGLHRFRDLRKGDDDFGYSRREETPSPAKLLETVVKEGAAVGIHVLVWCDGLNNLQRAFDRQCMREFEMRVLFQMSPNDSSTLIDSPAASKLGVNRALFHNEDLAIPEKFRPYALPSEAWLAEVKEQLGRKRVAEGASAAV